MDLRSSRIAAFESDHYALCTMYTYAKAHSGYRGISTTSKESLYSWIYLFGKMRT